MPYTKEHKKATRLLILKNAYRLFSTKGYSAITVNQLMSKCKLTRGGFYAHFDDKQNVYVEAIKYGISVSRLATPKPSGTSSKSWLTLLLDEYLSVEHVRGDRPCPLAFLVTDINAQGKPAKSVYTLAFVKLNEAIEKLVSDYMKCKPSQSLSATTLIIGSVAISRSISDPEVVEQLLKACRKEVGELLGGA